MEIRHVNEIKEEIIFLTREGRLEMTKQFIQHGDVSVYDHCIHVADLSLTMAERLHVTVNRRELIRGALLHDYFLYDWHDPMSHERLHGFHHAQAALENAQADFRLSEKERMIIARHMFPLNIKPPVSKEGWLVTMADKICSVQEHYEHNHVNHFDL